MQHQLRDLKPYDAIRAFQRAGGERRSGRGDHVNLKMPNGRIITLRTTGDVKIGRLKDALRESGITADEFARLLQ
ncbi:type II toxin-antitoxin system HicA family toxin [Candidatus Bipolaricaulota bacterium]|nr:type II toxin-antitoxin system HicA family toxin [Candidatus Bipolaricaulota bacterium]